MITRGTLPDEEVRTSVLQQVKDAVTYLWWQCMLSFERRDPSHIIIRRDGKIAIMDFTRVALFPFANIVSHPHHEPGDSGKPRSPIWRNWRFPRRNSNDFTDRGPWCDWLPKAWLTDKELMAQWLIRTWAGSEKYRQPNWDPPSCMPN